MTRFAHAPCLPQRLRPAMPGPGSSIDSPRPASAAASPAQPQPPDFLRRQLHLITLAWVFGSCWLWTISGAAMTQFARALHMPDFGFGILAAIPCLATLVQLPASYSLERFGHRKSVFLITGVASRALWILVAAIPWCLPAHPHAWWPAMALILLLSWTAANISSPAWMNWMSDLIPNQVRGRYFAIRNRLGRGVGIIITLAVGYLLDHVTASQTLHPHLMLKVTAAILAFGGLMGSIDNLLFRFVHDPPAPRPPQHTPLRKLLLTPLKDPDFRHYLAFNFTFMFGLGFIGQYVWVYVFDVEHWSNGQANLLLIAIPLLVQIATSATWGQLIDRLGKKPVLLITGFILSAGPLGFFFITPHHFWPGYLLVLFVTAAWPGMEIANFNMILGLSGGQRSQQNNANRGSIAYVAANAIAVALGGIASGLFSSIIADRLHDLHLILPLLGNDLPLTYHRLLLLCSAALRLISLLWILRLCEPQAAGTRDAVRYVTVSFYSNVRQAALMPARAVTRVARLSRRLPARR